MLSIIHNIYTRNAPEIHRRVEAKEFGLFFDNIKEEFYPSGTMVFTPEESGEKLYILTQGRVDLFRITSTGKRLVTRQILPGGVFGDMGLLGQTMQGNYALAFENSLIGVVTREDILAVLRQRPEVSLRLLETVGNRLRQIEERLVEATYSPVRVRIAHFILTNADSISGVLANLTHEEIGDIVGAARQTVTETLNLLQTQKLIVVEPKKIRIIDRLSLEKIVNS